MAKTTSKLLPPLPATSLTLLTAIFVPLGGGRVARLTLSVVGLMSRSNVTRKKDIVYVVGPIATPRTIFVAVVVVGSLGSLYVPSFPTLRSSDLSLTLGPTLRV